MVNVSIDDYQENIISKLLLENVSQLILYKDEFLKRINLYFSCMSECFLVYMGTMYMPGAYGDQKALDLLEMKL